MQKRLEYNKGDIIGNLIYIRDTSDYVSPKGRKKRMALFQCPLCGKEIERIIGPVKYSNAKSCGCIHKNNHHHHKQGICHHHIDLLVLKNIVDVTTPSTGDKD